MEELNNERPSCKVYLNMEDRLHALKTSKELYDVVGEIFKVEDIIFQELIDAILAEEFITDYWPFGTTLYTAKKQIGKISFKVELTGDYRFSIEAYPANTNYTGPFLKDQLLYKGYVTGPERIKEILTYYRLSKTSYEVEAEYEFLDHERRMWKENTGLNLNYRQVEELNKKFKNYGKKDGEKIHQYKLHNDLEKDRYFSWFG